MAAIRLRRVERVALVADVLRAVEHAEGQTGQEVTWRQIPGHGADLEPRLAPEISDIMFVKAVLYFCTLSPTC